MSILNRYEQNKEIFSNQETITFRLIWDEILNLQNKSLNDVVTYLNISRQSFLRIAKKLNYIDSNEFLLAINQQVMFSDIKSTAQLSPDVLQQNIHRIVDNLDQKQIKTVVNYLQISQRIFIISTGKAQKNQSEVLAYTLQKHGYYVVQIYDLFEINEICQHIDSNDLFLVLTRTGTSGELMTAVRLLSQTAAKVVTITSLRSNPLSSWSDFTMYVETRRIDGNVYELNAMFYCVFGSIDFYLLSDQPTDLITNKYGLTKIRLQELFAQRAQNLTIGNREVLLSLIDNPSLLFLSISSISQQLNVSTTSLFRLASALGFSGFKELRAQVNLSLHEDKSIQNQYTSRHQFFEILHETVDSVMATDYAEIHRLIAAGEKICIVYHNKYTEILADEFIRTFFHTDKLISKLDGRTSATSLNRLNDTLFILLVTESETEAEIHTLTSKMKSSSNKILCLARSDITIDDSNINRTSFFVRSPAMVRPFSDMWFIEFLFISYFY